MWNYLYNMFIALDQLLNAVLGGYPDETISSRAGKAALKGNKWPARIIDALFFWQEDHCKSAIEWDEGRTAEKLASVRTAKEQAHEYE